MPKTLLQDLQDLLWVDNEDYIKAVRLDLWSKRTLPKKLYLYIQDQDKLIIPYGFKDQLFKMLKETNTPYVIDNLHKPKPIEFELKNNLNLYDYQEKALKVVLNNNNGILVSPAGSGKTRMAMQLIKERGVKTLWLTHTLDLLRQSKRVYRDFFKNKAGEISGGKVNIQDITFATVQTMHNLDLEQFRDSFDMVIVDEVHRVGGTPTRLTMFYKILSNLNVSYRYGLTATIYPKPNKDTMVPLFLIGDILYDIDQEEVPRVTAKHIPIMLATDNSDIYLNPDRTINYSDLLSYLTYSPERNHEIFNHLIKTKDKHNIVLSNRNNNLEILSDMLTEKGIKNKVLIGNVKEKDREKMLNDFSKGKFPYLLSNYQLAKEGLDLPIADTLHLVMPMRDQRTVVQSKGRVERLYAGKTESFVYDYVDKKIGMLWRMFQDRERNMR